MNLGFLLPFEKEGRALNCVCVCVSMHMSRNGLFGSYPLYQSCCSLPRYVLG